MVDRRRVGGSVADQGCDSLHAGGYPVGVGVRGSSGGGVCDGLNDGGGVTDHWGGFHKGSVVGGGSVRHGGGGVGHVRGGVRHSGSSVGHVRGSVGHLRSSVGHLRGGVGYVRGSVRHGGSV